MITQKLAQNQFLGIRNGNYGSRFIYRRNHSIKTKHRKLEK